MKDRIGLLARLLTGGVWIWAGAVKLPNPAESVQAVRAYELVPGSLVVTVGHLLPVVEIVVGALLVLGLLTRVVGLISSLLFLAFVIGFASVWARGIEIDCGCFGGGGAQAGASTGYPWEIARDTALLLASGYLVVRGSRLFALDSWLLPRTVHPKTEHGADAPQHADAGPAEIEGR